VNEKLATVAAAFKHVIEVT